MDLKEIIIKIDQALDKDFDNKSYLDIPELKNLTLVQVHYLETISRLGNPTVTELTQELEVAKSSVSVIVNKLVAKGYIKKVPSTDDGRSFNIHATEMGLKLEKLYNKVNQEMFKKFVGKVKRVLNNKEIQTLETILEKVITSL